MYCQHITAIPGNYEEALWAQFSIISADCWAILTEKREMWSSESPQAVRKLDIFFFIFAFLFQYSFKSVEMSYQKPHDGLSHKVKIIGENMEVQGQRLKNSL